MKYKTIYLSIAFTIILTGCASQQSSIELDKKPPLQVPKQAAPVKTKKGSLYSRRGTSLFADKKDLQIGDIIQVLIDETLTNESDNSRETKKDTTTGLGAGSFTVGSPTSTVGSVAQKLNRNTNIGFSATSGNSFKGSSKQSTDEEFTTVISAVITQTYQNGNYFIEGSKEMLINGQKQNIKISGLIRPYDITPENTINSNQLANLKIMYEKDGVEMDAIKKPWGSKVLETIWPF